VFQGGSIYQVEVDAAGNSDKVVAGGTATLNGGTVQVLAQNGNYAPSTKYTILTANGGVSGVFTGVTSNLAFLDPSLLYDANDVFLVLERMAAIIGPGGPVSFLSFCSVAETRNQCNVAHALDQFLTDNPLFLDILNQTAQGAREAFNALSGEVHASVSGVLADDSRYVREAVLGRLTQATYTNGNGQVASLGAGGPQVASLDSQAMTLGSDEAMSLGSAATPYATPAYGPGIAFWTNAFGAWGNFDGNNNAASADRNLGGFVSGMDANVGGSWRLGLATGYSQSDISVDARHSGADVTDIPQMNSGTAWTIADGGVPR
jgi:outer membrane autotransporter protein